MAGQEGVCCPALIRFYLVHLPWPQVWFHWQSNGERVVEDAHGLGGVTQTHRVRVVRQQPVDQWRCVHAGVPQQTTPRRQLLEPTQQSYSATATVQCNVRDPSDHAADQGRSDHQVGSGVVVVIIDSRPVMVVEEWLGGGRKAHDF